MKTKPLVLIILVVVVAIGAFLIGSKYGKQPVPNVVVPTTQVATTTGMGTDNDGMDDEHAFLQADYNFDGYPDRLQMLNCGATGNCSYEVHLYDPKTKEYLAVSDSSVMDVIQEPGADGEITFVVTNPEVNKEEKLVCSYANVGSGTYYLSVYTYSVKNNTFTQVKEFSGSTDKVHKCSLK